MLDQFDTVVVLPNSRHSFRAVGGIELIWAFERYLHNFSSIAIFLLMHAMFLVRNEFSHVSYQMKCLTLNNDQSFEKKSSSSAIHFLRPDSFVGMR